jgi:uncharacterized coiled-coil DUF342 family protein
MYEDLKQLLEQMRQENAAAHQETRQRVDGLHQEFNGLRQEFGGLRQENDAAHLETRQRVDGLGQHVDGLGQQVDGLGQQVDGLGRRVDGLGQQVDGLRQEVDSLHAAHRETQRSLDDFRRENELAHVVTRRHFDVNVERMDHRFDAVAEAFLMLDEKVDRRLTQVEDQVDRWTR